MHNEVQKSLSGVILQSSSSNKSLLFVIQKCLSASTFDTANTLTEKKRFRNINVGKKPKSLIFSMKRLLFLEVPYFMIPP